MIPQHPVPANPPRHYWRQLIADKGSFDGGTSSVRVKVLSSTIRCEAMEANGRLCRVGRDEANTGVVISPTTTFRAALPERRINVERVSIRGGLAEMQVMNGPYTLPLRETHRPREAVVNGRATSNADSYSRKPIVRGSPSVKPAEAGVVSWRVHRSPALRQRSWPNVDNQRTPRSYPQVAHNPGGICLSQDKSLSVAYATRDYC